MAPFEVEAPRGRRMPRDERRAQVLAAAQELFAREGYHHVSMDDIAARSDITKPVLYRHFPSKLDLYLAVVDARGAGLLAAVGAALAPIEHGAVHPGDGRAVVHAIVRAYFEFVEGAGESASLLFESDVTRDTAVRSRVETAGAEAARGIARVLVDVTGLPVPHTQLLATTLVGLAQSGATSRLRSGGEMTLEQSVDLVARLAWGGVASLVRADYQYDVPGAAAPPGDASTT